jgi:hypothetical protein
MVKQTFAKVDLYGWTSEVFLDVHGGPKSLSMTLIPFFVKVNPVISHLHLSNGPSKTNLGSQRYLSEINEPWPLRPMVELQGRASFLFLRLSEESMYLSRTLSPTFMKVTSARTRVIPLSSVKYT